MSRIGQFDGGRRSRTVPPFSPSASERGILKQAMTSACPAWADQLTHERFAVGLPQPIPCDKLVDEILPVMAQRDFQRLRARVWGIIPHHFAQAEISVLSYGPFNTMIGGPFVPFHELGKRAVITAGRFQKVEIKPAAIADMWTDLPIYPDVEPGLNRMRQLGYLLVPVTQFSSDMVRKGLVDRHPFKWDAWFTSDMWGVYKPHRDIYLKSIAAMDLHPSEVLFVTQNQFDMFGAKGVGLRLAWINRANQPLEAYGAVPARRSSSPAAGPRSSRAAAGNARSNRTCRLDPHNPR